MGHIVLRDKEIQSFIRPHLGYEFPLQSKGGTPQQEIIKPDVLLLESMVEQELRPFHQKSKNDMMIIYDLSQEVYYRHYDKNPELAKLAASLFLFFSDFGFYLNIENQRLIPAALDMIEKVQHPKIGKRAIGLPFQELKNKIQREHYSFIDKLKYFRIMTGNYRIPENASKPYKLLFDKLKKLENDLVTYIHFENDRFFPLVIEMEYYLKENKLMYYGKV